MRNLIAIATVSFTFLAACAAPKAPGQKATPHVDALASMLNGMTVQEIREFIHENSTHDLDRGFGDLDPNDHEAVAKVVLMGLRSGEKPVLFCGHRAGLMVAILNAQNIQARVVNIYRDAPLRPGVQGHVFTEVMTAQGWQMQDPDYDIEYQLPDGRPAGIGDLIFTENALPCRAGVCAWEQDSPEGFPISEIRELAGAATVGYSVIYVNPDRYEVGIETDLLAPLYREYPVVTGL